MWKQASWSVFCLFYHVPIMFSLRQFFTDNLRAPWLPYLLFHGVRKFFSLSVGHCFEAECLTGRRKEAIMGRGGKKWSAFISNWRQKNRNCRADGVEEELEAMGFSSASLRWESEKNTQKTHSRFPNTFHHTKRTAPGSNGWLLQQETVQKTI